MAKNKLIHAEVPSELRVRLVQKAKESRVTISTVIRWALYAYLEGGIKS